jgi:hypothetical protein
VCDLNLARKLCARIAIEDDPAKVTDKLKLLVAYRSRRQRRGPDAYDDAYALTFSKAGPDWDVD